MNITIGASTDEGDEFSLGKESSTMVSTATEIKREEFTDQIEGDINIESHETKDYQVKYDFKMTRSKQRQKVQL